jgi:nucleoside-diphosphate-sugar epimerase
LRSTYYGNRVPPLQEDMLFRPSSPYGGSNEPGRALNQPCLRLATRALSARPPAAASKYMGELIMTSYNHVYGLPTLNLRFFMVYGPRQPSTGAYAIVTGVFVDQFNRGGSSVIQGVDGLAAGRVFTLPTIILSASHPAGQLLGNLPPPPC